MCLPLSLHTAAMHSCMLANALRINAWEVLVATLRGLTLYSCTLSFLFSGWRLTKRRLMSLQRKTGGLKSGE